MKIIATPALPATVARCLALWALAACAAAPAVEDELAGRAASKMYTRIVGGMEAEAEAWPWQVALVLPRGSGFRQFCGGSLIHPRWVLTAAHCVDVVSADDIQVLAGTHDLDEGGRRIDVKAIRVHPEYVDPVSSGNDIALLELAGPAGVDEAVTLPDAERSVQIAGPAVPATAIGWGLLRPLRCVPGSESGAFRCHLDDGGTGRYVDDLTGQPVKESDVTTSRLMEVTLPLVGEGACLDAYPGAAIDDRTLCAGLEVGGLDSCQGDSGGPLVVRDGDEWVQVGVVSWGAGCAKPGMFGVYTSTGAFARWVNETTGRELVVAGGAGGTEAPSSEGAPAVEGAPAPPRGDRALLIGINHYPADEITDLQGAVNDVHNMRDLLTGHLGFDAGQVRVLTDAQATREGILAGIRDWLVAGTRPGARALLYFAGHGVQQPDGDDGDEEDGLDEALVPHDTRPASAAGGLPRYANLILDDEVGALFDELADRRAYLIVDSCFSGTITRDLSLVSPDPRVVRTILPRRGAARGATATRSAAPELPTVPAPGFVEREGNLVAWTAVASNQLALEDVVAPRRQGFFTGRFVRGIAEKAADLNRDGRIVHWELLDYVRRESEAYCASQQRHCRGGLTPTLEGPLDIFERDVRDLAVVADGASNAEVADAALGHGNAADVRLEMLPSRRVRLDQELIYRVHSGRSGHLLLVDVNAAGEVTQLFPYALPGRPTPDARIEAGGTVEIGRPGSRIRLWAAEPTGPGTLFAVVTEDPVSLDGLVSADRGFESVADAPRWLRAIGERLREPLMSKDGTWTRTRRWSFARLDYEIVAR